MTCYRKTDLRENMYNFLRIIGSGRAGTRAKRLLEKGRQFSREKKWFESAEAYRGALDLVPAFEEAVLGLAEALRASGRRGESFEVLDRARTSQPASVQIAIRYSRALIDEGRFDDAERLLRKLADRPGYFNSRKRLRAIRLLLVRSATEQKRWSEAIDLANAILGDNPKDSNAWIRLGHVHKERGAFGDAVAAYESAIRLSPIDSDAWLHLGHAHKNGSNHNEALLAYARAATLSASGGPAHKALQGQSGHDSLEAETLLRSIQTSSALSMKSLQDVAIATEASQYAKNEFAAKHLELKERLQRRGSAFGPLAGHDVVFLPNIDWNYRHQRSQHLARELGAAGAVVLYVANALESDRGQLRYRLLEERYPSVFEVKLSANKRALAHEGIDGVDAKSVASSIRALVESLALSKVTLFVQHPGWAPVVQLLEEYAIVYDSVDDFQSFQNVSCNIKNAEKTLFECADGVVTVSNSLRSKMSSNITSCTIRNGVEYCRFSNENPELQSTSQIRIGYVGAISDWFDVDLILEAAMLRPDWEFCLVGEPEEQQRQRLSSQQNVKLYGEMHYSDISKFIATCSVMIVPFKRNPLTLNADLVKIYEYFAVGKPVVSTIPPEDVELAQLLQVVETPVSLVKAVERAVGEGSTQISSRKTYASSNDWRHRGDLLVAFIKSLHPNIELVTARHQSTRMIEGLKYPVQVRWDDAPKTGCADYLLTIRGDESAYPIRPLIRQLLQDNRVVAAGRLLSGEIQTFASQTTSAPTEQMVQFLERSAVYPG